MEETMGDKKQNIGIVVAVLAMVLAVPLAILMSSVSRTYASVFAVAVAVCSLIVARRLGPHEMFKMNSRREEDRR